MKKTCRHCNKDFEFERGRQFGAHLTNCSENPAKKQRDLNQVRSKDYHMECLRCGDPYMVRLTEHQYDTGDYKKHCSRTCANTRVHTEETKEKISKGCSKGVTMYKKTCPCCSGEYETKKPHQKYCGKVCSIKVKNDSGMARMGGFASVNAQNRRSKNEVAFADLCIEKFDDVLLNEPMFNGWDADIIINDLKVAILWNGAWHYKKITEKHSVKQVQNRDRIKIKEIEMAGYVPYIIKDMGKHSMEKVTLEWSVFNEWSGSLQ
jgi:hypothetical protein